MERFAGLACLSGGFFLAGTSVIAGRYVSGIVGTFTVAAISLLFALAVLLPFCRNELSKIVPKLSGRAWLQIGFQALFGIFLFRVFILQGLIYTTAGEAGILTGATPAVTALLAGLVLKEELHRLRSLGIMCTVLGILAIQGLFSQNGGLSWEHATGNLLVLCAAVSESLFNVLSKVSYIKEGKDQQGNEPIVQTTLVVGVALVLCLAPALLEQPWVSLRTISSPAWLALSWYGVAATALAYYFWYSGIRRSDASVAAAFSGMMPLTSLALSIWLLKEQPGETQLAGGALVVLGMVLTGWPNRANNTDAEEVSRLTVAVMEKQQKRLYL